MNIEVMESGKRHCFQAEAGSSLLECLLREGLLKSTECSGRGVCKKCLVAVRSGRLGATGNDESPRNDGRVLACRSVVEEDVVIEIVSGRDDVERKVRLPNLNKGQMFSDPQVEKKFIRMAAPSLRDQASDLERVLAQAGKNSTVAPGVLRQLPQVLRASDFAVTVTLANEELIAVEPGDARTLSYGFILDIGTTTIAVYLVDLHSGEVLGANGVANPQQAFGADVLSRVAAADTEGNLETMQAMTLEAVSTAMRQLLQEHALEESNVYSVVVVGNTTMSHLFLGVDPKNLAVAPFIPCFRSRTTVRGRDLGLPMHQEGIVQVLPNISGYVGSDALGVAMATKAWELPGYTLAVDIGTNGEILLGYKGWMLACSTAAGPAFEGAHIYNGMRAGQGAIEAVRFTDDGISLEVIGKTAPEGICGSGLIDAVAELLRVGVLAPSGRLVEKAPAFLPSMDARLRARNGMREFVLVFAGERGSRQDIVITQKDVRELQLAKAAIAAGISIMLQEVNIDASRIDRVFLAGAFGNYLDREKAVALGMFPGISTDKIIPIGNAAAEGAGLCLLSKGQRKMADRMAAFIKPVELSARADFNDRFVKEIGFPPPPVGESAAHHDPGGVP